MVGRKIRQRRVALSISQSALAAGLGLTFQQLQKIERGINRIGAGRLWQVAILLKVPVMYFYEGLEHTVDPHDETNDAANHFLGRRDGQRLASALYDMPPAIRGAIMRLVITMDEQAKLQQ